MTLCIYTKYPHVCQVLTYYYILLLKPFTVIPTGNWQGKKTNKYNFLYSHNNHYVILCQFNFYDMGQLIKKVTRIKQIFCGLFTGKFIRSKCMVHSTTVSAYYLNDVLKQGDSSFKYMLTVKAKTNSFLKNCIIHPHAK